MSTNEPIDNAEVRDAVEAERRRLEEKFEAERRTLLQQAAEQGAAEQLAEKRAELEREVEEVREEIARDSPAEERARARRAAPSAILLLLLLLLILYLIAVVTGRSDIISFPSSRLPPTVLPSQTGSGGPGDGNTSLIGGSNVVGPRPEAVIGYPVDPLFQPYYDQNGGYTVFGRAITPLQEQQGRRFQWFERARLEEWPENRNASPSWLIQGGRLGIEYTKGISFPLQTAFISTPDNYYFAETNHGVRGAFLDFWRRNNGLVLLGFPISDEVQEELDDGQVHTVQYFERGRLELHNQNPAPSNVMMGLLGTELKINNSKPRIIPPLAVPTPVPLNQ